MMPMMISIQNTDSQEIACFVFPVIRNATANLKRPSIFDCGWNKANRLDPLPPSESAPSHLATSATSSNAFALPLRLAYFRRGSKRGSYGAGGRPANVLEIVVFGEFTNKAGIDHS